MASRERLTLVRQAADPGIGAATVTTATTTTTTTLQAATTDDAPNASSSMSNETPPATPTTVPPPPRREREPVKPNTKIAKSNSNSKSKTKTKSISTLESEIAATEANLAATLSRLSASQASSSLPLAAVRSTADEGDQSPPSLDDRQQLLNDAQGIFDRHIVLLKKYNEIKDVAMGMLSLIAEREGKRLAEVMQERGLGGDDD
jgi:hypothetical protein